MIKKSLSNHLKLILIVSIIILQNPFCAHAATISDSDLNELNKTIANQQIDIVYLKAEKIGLQAKIEAGQAIRDDMEKQRSKDMWIEIALILMTGYAIGK